MGDYEYYEEPQPVPTFSDGSSGGGRGANSRAAASRASASKSAVSAASRASAMMAASIQQLPKNAIITSNGIRNLQPSMPAVNMAAIKAAQKRSENVMRTAKPPEPLLVQLPPRDVVANIPESTTILHPVQPENIVTVVSKAEYFSSTLYKDAVTTALSRKQELLDGRVSSEPPVVKKYRATKCRKYSSSETELPVNKEALQKLSVNLVSLLNSPNKTAILDEFNQYQTSLRISIEQPCHKNAVEQALAIKALYLTSDA